LLLLSSFTTSATVLQGSIRNFRLFTCGQEICFSITSDKAYLGRVDGNYAFDQARIVIFDKKSNEEKTVNSQDVYYDIRSNYLFIRNADEKKVDLVFNVKEQKITKFSH
jgi:hypothetical protein